jgi:tetratricopeptide (TPR) repeat protein/tRNA A-37 threonylcarbamoyl transferase component Bud32
MASEVVTEREKRLNDLIVAYLEAVQSGETPDRASWLRDHPDLADELADFFTDQDRVRCWTEPLRPVVEAARLRTGETPHPGTTLDTTVPLSSGAGAAFGDYELLEEIGRGGMGVVYKARQKRLDRLVALKVVRGEGIAGADTRRFRNEAETVAQLDHPNIVPVHEVGEQPGGLSYFSMKLIAGGSLAEQLLRFRDDPRAAAGLLAKVARAVHHAHQRGVLHRDLKPANILLDAQGEPHVSDFGLAKRLECPGQEVTQSGAIVGTPAYMAPEQASGRKGAVTTAADVYGLGAVLYALLTGRPPFQAESPLYILAQVRECEPEPLRRGNAKVDRDLETVCLKCLQKEPVRRYESAGELADDLERWLRREPIRARPVGSTARLWRWCRRNPLVAGLTATLVTVLIAAVVVLGFSSALIAQKRDEAEANLRQARQALASEQRAAKREREQAQQARLQEAEADRQRQLAETHFREARQAVDDAFTLVSENHLLHEPCLDPLRKELLQNTLRYYTGFLKERGDNPALRAEVAAAHLRVAQITQALGPNEEWLVAFEKGVAVVEQLVRNHVKESEFGSLRAGIFRGSGRYLHPPAHPKKFLTAFQKSRDLWETLVRTHPNVRGFQNNLAGQCNVVGLLQLLCGQPQEAIRSHERARMLWAQLVRQEPENPFYRAIFALNEVSLATALEAAQRPDEAEAAYKRALEVQKQLVMDFPKIPMYPCDLSTNYRRQAQFLMDLGRLEEAEEACRRSHAHASKLVTAYPTVSVYRLELGNSHNTLGIICSKRGQLQEAEKCFRHSLAQVERLMSDFPERLDYRANLIAANTNLAYLLLRTRQFREAARALRRWMELSPNDPKPHVELAFLLADCTDAMVRDPAQAIKMASNCLAGQSVCTGIADNLRLCNSQRFRQR